MVVSARVFYLVPPLENVAQIHLIRPHHITNLPTPSQRPERQQASFPVDYQRLNDSVRMANSIFSHLGYHAP